MDNNNGLMRIGEYMKILHRYIGTERTDYEFVQYICQIIMREPQNEVEELENENDNYYPFSGDIKKDYWGKIYRDAKEFPTKAAEKILSKYGTGLLAKVIQDLDEIAKSCMVEDLHGKHIRCRLAMLPSLCDELMLEHIKARVDNEKGVDISKFNSGAIIQRDDDIPFLIEALNRCVKCHKLLYDNEEGKITYKYKIVHINPYLKGIQLNDEENLIALCRDCALEYGFAPSQEEINDLEDEKVKLETIREGRESKSYDDIISGIEQILIAISLMNTNIKETSGLIYEPLRVREKVKDNNRLCRNICDDVEIYYEDIELLCKQIEIKREDDDGFFYKSLCDIVREQYIGLNDIGTLSQNEIYKELSNRLYLRTHADIDCCEILISFFVQHCEVF